MQDDQAAMEPNEEEIAAVKGEPRRVKLRLVGLDGNAFALMGAFQRQAKKEKWTTEEIDAVLDDCRSGNYDHLLCVLMDHCEEPE